MVKVSAKLIRMSHKDDEDMDEYNITELNHHMMEVRANPTPVAKPDAGSPAPCAEEAHSTLASYASTVAQQKQLLPEQRELCGEGTNHFMHRVLVPKPPDSWQDPPDAIYRPRSPCAANSLANRFGQSCATGQLESPPAIAGTEIRCRESGEDVRGDGDGKCGYTLGQAEADLDSPAPSALYCMPFLTNPTSPERIFVEEARSPPRLHKQLADVARSLERSEEVGIAMSQFDSSSTPLQSHPVPHPPVRDPAPPAKMKTDFVSGEQDVRLMPSSRRPSSGARKIVERNVVKN